jgi:hypothetical protein
MNVIASGSLCSSPFRLAERSFDFASWRRLALCFSTSQTLNLASQSLRHLLSLSLSLSTNRARGSASISNRNPRFESPISMLLQRGRIREPQSHCAAAPPPSFVALSPTNSNLTALSSEALQSIP